MARLPEGALMQRAAAGLAYAVLDLLGSAYGRRVLLLVGSGRQRRRRAVRRRAARPARVRRSRRGCCPTTPTRPGWPRCGPPAAGSCRPACARAHPQRTTRRGRRRDRRDRRTRRAAARGRGRRWRRSRGVPVVAVDIPSRRRRRHRRARRAARRRPTSPSPSAPTRSRTSSTRRPRPAASSTSSTSASTCPPAPVEALQPEDVAALLPRPAGDAQKYTRGVVGVRAGSAAVPRRRPAQRRRRGDRARAAWCGTSATDAVADRVRQAHPEVVGDGRVQAWVVGSGGGERAGRRARRGPARTACRVVVDADALAHVDGPLGVPAVLTPHAGELAAMLGVERADVEARPLRARAPGRGERTARGAAQGPPHAGRRARRPGPGDHDRHALAGHRRRRRRARRPGRRAARRRPRRRTTPRRSAPGCTAPRRPSPRAAARSSRARSRATSRGRPRLSAAGGRHGAPAATR